ncbi:MAG: hypothetical protein ACREGJ_03860 [Candidatus Saccharimonadales bacterium]
MRKFFDWIRHEKRSIYFEYSVLVLAIMLPMLLPGYILTLDLVFAPHIAWPTELTNSYPLQAVLALLNFAIPADVIEKIVLFAILLLSGVGTHRLVRTIPASSVAPEYWKWGAYFAGILYMVNPFVYSRFMAGQWQVLLGYALLPFFVRSVITLVAKPSRKSALSVAAWLLAISIVSIHHVGIAVLVAAIAGVLALWRYRKDSPMLRRFIGWAAASMAIVLVVSSYWLIPALMGSSSIAQSVESFDTAHHHAFATNNEGALGAIGNVIRLQGFWLDARGLYVLPQDQVPIWGLAALVLWVVVGIGAVAAWRKQRFMALLFGISALAAIILAVSPLMSWLSEIIPFFNGYREPQKFVNILVFAYAYFGALGVASLLTRFHERANPTVTSGVLVGALLLPLVFTPTMLWGFSGQLSPRHYPADWYAMNEKLNADTQDFKVLFLPWHQYMHFGFAGRIIANPGDKFFDKPFVVGDNPEFKDISPTVPNAAKREIQETLKHPEHLARTLTNQNIKYVLLAKEHDFEDYKFLNESPDFNLTTETETLKLYEIKRR